MTEPALSAVGGRITTAEQLDALFGPVPAAALFKEKDRLVPVYQKLVENAPFVAVATVGAQGVDCSPRGDFPQVVHVVDETTLALPQRAGNNRIDTLHNLLGDARIGLLFLLPGRGETLRVRGRAVITTDETWRARYCHHGRPPQCVVLIDIERVYFQCANSVTRARLWTATVEDVPDSKTLINALKADES